jgi:uncharacterized protein (TIGR00369 family)
MSFENGLHLEITERHEDGVTVKLPITSGLMNNQGVMHGGIIAALADEAAWEAIQQVLGGGRVMTTTELKVNYLAPITGENAFARGYVARAGKTLCVTRVDVHSEQQRLCAIGIVTYILLDRK